MTCHYVNKLPLHKFINSIDNKGYTKLSKVSRENYDNNPNGKCSLANDLKLVSNKLLYQHQHKHEHNYNKDRDINHDLTQKLSNRIKPKRRLIAPICICNHNYSNFNGNSNANIKKNYALSPSLPKRSLFKNNTISLNVSNRKQIRSLKLFYSPHDSKQEDSMKNGQRQQKKNASSNSNSSLLIASIIKANHSRVYYKRLEDFKDQNQCHSTSALQKKVIKVFKSNQRNNNNKSKQMLDNISPNTKEKKKNYFLIKSKSYSRIKPKQVSMEEKEPEKNDPLLWQLKSHRDLSAKDLITLSNNSHYHHRPFKCDIYSPITLHAQIISYTIDDDNYTNINPSKHDEPKIVRSNDKNNEDEANVIVTTINNQYDNLLSSSQLTICASKKLFFFPIDNELVTQQVLICFSSSDISNAIIQYLNMSDTFSLSFVNRQCNHLTKRARYTYIKSKVLSQNDDIHGRIWRQLMTYSKLNSELSLMPSFNANGLNPCLYVSDIKKDIIRTFPNEPTFSEDSVVYNQLYDILNEYANYNKKIGYAQGMNFIAAKILHKFKNKKVAFIILDAIMVRLKMEQIMGVSNSISSVMGLIGKLIKDNVPHFDQFLDEHMLSHELCTANWVLTLFSNSIANEYLYLIWEFIFIFSWEFINYFVLAIIEAFQDTITAFSFNSFSDNMKELLYSDAFKNKFNDVINTSFEYMINVNSNQEKIKEEVK